MGNITDRELDKLLEDALHDEADYLTVSERLKERIDKEIAIKTHLCEKGESNFATICLNLFESIEVKARRQNVIIRCLPSDDAFGRSLVLEDYVFLALEYVFSEFVLNYNTVGNKVLVSTKENSICIKGLNVSELKLRELCVVGEKTYTVDQSDMGIAISFLQLRGINIRVSETKDIQIVFFKGL